MAARIHPWIVHFPVALLLLAAALFLLGSLFRRRPWSATLLTVARWNLWIGAGFALASIGTGFLDYISASCDQAAIDATILHRRSGAVTWWSSLIVGIAAWRTRERPPGPWLLAGMAIVALAALVAARLGTDLTYGRGLGVAPAWSADARAGAGEDASACFARERAGRSAD